MPDPNGPDPNRPDPNRPERVTLPLLTLITQQSLDEDYLAAAEKRVGDPARVTGRAQRVTAVMIAVFGILVTTAAVQTSRTAGVDDASRSSLVERIPARRERASALQDQIVRTREQIAALEEQYQQLTSTEQSATNRLRRLQVRTGYTAVSGEGVRITVTSAPQAAEGDRVNDADLALLVNGLWEAGAEAIAINGQRLTALGAIRISGSTIMVNRRPISPPYVVLAIGDTRSLQANLAETTAGRSFYDVAARFGFAVTRETEDRLVLPGAALRTLRDVEVASSDDGPPQEEDAP